MEENNELLYTILSCDDVALFQIDDDVTPLSVDKLIRLNHRVDCPVSWPIHPTHSLLPHPFFVILTHSAVSPSPSCIIIFYTR